MSWRKEGGTPWYLTDKGKANQRAYKKLYRQDPERGARMRRQAMEYYYNKKRLNYKLTKPLPRVEEIAPLSVNEVVE